MASRIKGITIELNGDTTGLQKALKDVNGKVSETQSSLKDVNKLLKLDPGNTELLTQKHRLLADAVDATKEKLQALKTAAEQANEKLANGEISQSQYDALQREIIETEHRLEDLERQADQSSVALQKIAAKGADLKKLGDSVTDVGEKFLPATAAVAGLGTAAVATAASFESAMSQVQATMGITKDAMTEVNGETVNTVEALSGLAKEMGESTAFSAKECAEALNYLALAGYDAQEMYDTLPIVLNLAAAGSLDLASASDMVTDAMSALGMKTSDASKMVDQMAKTASSTNTSVAQLGEGILTIGATAKTVSGGTAELNTALGILANNGIKSAEGGTHLRNVIMSLQSPTGKAYELMQSLGLAAFDSAGNFRPLNDILTDLNRITADMTQEEKTNVISQLFNKTDIAAVNALLANTGETWSSLQADISNSTGAAGDMAATQLDNLQGQLTLLKSALEGLAISVGEIILPYVKSFVEHIQKLVDWLNGLSDTQKKIVVGIGLVVAAIGPVLIVIGTLMSSIGNIMMFVPKLAGLTKAFSALGPVIKGVTTGFRLLGAAMLANPIGLIIAAVAALVAGFIYLWNNCEGFRNFWINLWENIKAVVSTVVDAIVGFFSGLADAIGAVFTAIRDIVSSIWQGIVDRITAVWNSFYEVFGPLIEAFRYLFEAIFEAIHVLVSRAMDAISEKIKAVWNAIYNFLSPILNAIANAFQTVWNAITGFFQSILEKQRAIIEKVWNAISGFVSTIMNKIKDAFTAIWEAVKNAIGDKITAIYNTIKGGLEKAWDYIKNIGKQAFQWGADIIQGIIDGIKSKIAGITNAVRGVADKIHSFLHFSEPDEGPLADFHTWMPDFMRGLAQDIERSKHYVTSAMEDVSGAMSLNPTLAIGAGSANSTVEHTGTIRVEGVNSRGQLTDVVDIIVKQMRREARMA